METLQPHIDEIMERGFSVIPDVLKAEDLDFLRANMDAVYASYDPEKDTFGRVEGYNFVANLVNKHLFFHTLFLRPPVYDIAKHFLGDDCILASMNSLEPLKGQGNQGLHREAPTSLTVVSAMNSMWVVDGMDRSNGATRVLPGSHKADIKADADETGVIQAEAPAGAVVLINAALVHGASANHSGARRRILHVYYTRRENRQHTDFGKYLSEETKAALSPLSRRVLKLDE